MSSATAKTLSVLLVEDSVADGRLLLETLRPAVNAGEVLVQTVKRLALAMEELQRFDFNCVLLDLGLPDGHGVDNVRALRAVDHRPAIVVLTGLDDEAVAAQALQFGAQDYLLKGGTDAEQLLRLIRRAIQRNRQTVQLEHQRDSAFMAATRDPLTLLPNLALLLDRARMQQAESHTLQQPFGLGVLVLDGLDALREKSGKALAEQRLREVAEAMVDGLRPADTLARIAPNTFALLARPVLTREQLDALLQKLADLAMTHEPTHALRASLHPKVSSRWQRDEQQTIEQLLAEAIEAVIPTAIRTPMANAAIFPASIVGASGQWQPWVDVNTSRCGGALWQQGDAATVATATESALGALRQLREQLVTAAQNESLSDGLCLPLPAASWKVPAESLLALLGAQGIAPRSVLLQLPQSLLASAQSTVTSLHDAGLQLLLDFDTDSPPSLAEITQWPLHGIRLHPQHWQRVLDDNLRGPRRRALEALMGAAQALGIRVIACGVEHAEARDALRAIGLRWMQGAALLRNLDGPALVAATAAAAAR